MSRALTQPLLPDEDGPSSNGADTLFDDDELFHPDQITVSYTQTWQSVASFIFFPFPSLHFYVSLFLREPDASIFNKHSWLAASKKLMADPVDVEIYVSAKAVGMILMLNLCWYRSVIVWPQMILPLFWSLCGRFYEPSLSVGLKQPSMLKNCLKKKVVDEMLKSLKVDVFQHVEANGPSEQGMDKFQRAMLAKKVDIGDDEDAEAVPLSILGEWLLKKDAPLDKAFGRVPPWTKTLYSTNSDGERVLLDVKEVTPKLKYWKSVFSGLSIWDENFARRLVRMDMLSKQLKPLKFKHLPDDECLQKLQKGLSYMYCDALAAKEIDVSTFVNEIMGTTTFSTLPGLGDSKLVKAVTLLRMAVSYCLTFFVLMLPYLLAEPETPDIGENATATQNRSMVNRSLGTAFQNDTAVLSFRVQTIPFRWVAFAVWANWGVGGFFFLFFMSAHRTGMCFKQAVARYRSLSRMVLGPVAAGMYLLPFVGVEDQGTFLFWAELRLLLNAQLRATKIGLEIKLGLALTSTVLMVAYTANDIITTNEWIPDFVFFVTLCSVLMVVMNVLPALYTGLELNKEIKRIGILLTQLHVEQASFNMFHRHSSHFDHAELEKSQQLLGAIVRNTELDNTNYVSILGLQLTSAGLASFASTLSAAGLVLIHHVNVPQAQQHFQAIINASLAM